MVRPKRQPSDRGGVEIWLADQQDKRFNTLKTFRDVINSSDVVNDVEGDDELFVTIIKLAIDDYGIKQQELANRVKYSSAAVSRWSDNANLPRPDSRPRILERIRELLDEAIALQMGGESNERKRVLSGRWLPKESV